MRPNMTSGAREAVARALAKPIPLGSSLTQADYVLAALAPIIAAEIRAWAEEIHDGSDPYGDTRFQLVTEGGADTIASRICGGGERCGKSVSLPGMLPGITKSCVLDPSHKGECQ